MKRSQIKRQRRNNRQQVQRNRFKRSQLRVETLENRIVLSTMTMGPMPDRSPPKPDSGINVEDIRWEKNPFDHNHGETKLRGGKFKPSGKNPCVNNIGGSISYDLPTRTIEVRGTVCDDNVEVQVVQPKGWGKMGPFKVTQFPQVKVTLNNRVRNFSLGMFPVKQVHFLGLEGDDLFWNRTGISSVAEGGPGVDSLIGGSGDDVLMGQSEDDFMAGNDGHDQIFGGPGNDTAYGGAGRDHMVGGLGHDTLYGENGRDRLEGGNGEDKLYGGNGRDVLYGGLDTDYLSGGDADDSLFAGLGPDIVNGGSGGDRFLARSGIGWGGGDAFATIPIDDTFEDLNSNDTFIGFRDAGDFLRSQETCSGEEELVQWTGGSWTDAEIEMLDDAFAVLHERTGNTELFKGTTENSEPDLEFYRVGASNNPCVNPYALSQFGHIEITDRAINATPARLHQSLFHHIGFDWAGEFATWGDFTSLSTWMPVAPGDYVDSWMSTTPDEQWAYLDNTAFASNQGRESPSLDFATVFATYFMNEAGEPYLGTPIGDITDKLDFVDNWVESLVYP
jgi:hypothetical protein